jgi:hypothetical protein
MRAHLTRGIIAAEERRKTAELPGIVRTGSRRSSLRQPSTPRPSSKGPKGKDREDKARAHLIAKHKLEMMDKITSLAKCLGQRFIKLEDFYDLMENDVVKAIRLFDNLDTADAFDYGRHDASTAEAEAQQDISDAQRTLLRGMLTKRIRDGQS